MKSCLYLLKIAAVTVVFLCLGMSLSWAVIEGGDSKQGKTLSKEKCKHCHVTGADGGTMTPLSKTQRQWERFYKKNRHEKLAPGAWEDISEQELKDIMQFMHDHAADSPQPQTCG